MSTPELRTVGDGVPMCQFVLASGRNRVEADGNRRSDFIPCVCWRGTADFATRNLVKGQCVIVTGRLNMREQVGEEKHSVLEVVVSSISFCGPKPVQETQEEESIAEVHSRVDAV